MPGINYRFTNVSDFLKDYGSFDDFVTMNTVCDELSNTQFFKGHQFNNPLVGYTYGDVLLFMYRLIYLTLELGTCNEVFFEENEATQILHARFYANRNANPDLAVMLEAYAEQKTINVSLEFFNVYDYADNPDSKTGYDAKAVNKKSFEFRNFTDFKRVHELLEEFFDEGANEVNNELLEGVEE